MDRARFEADARADCAHRLETVARVDAHSANRHLQIANLLPRADGQWLLICRWDKEARSEREGVVWRHGEKLGNSAEGDCTNEQVLFFSTDDGRSWTTANDGESIVTLAQGTSFPLPSAVTHAFLDEDADGRVFAYYTLNQPMTCGREAPWRATGGGEVRRVPLFWDGKTWRAAAGSELVLGVFSPMPDGRGGVTRTLRFACLNPILRLRDGVWLMPLSARDTLPVPEGMYWRENRCYVLRSTDGGQSWTPHFIGGNNELCLCECTLCELSDGSVYALMRAGYGTGDSLYAARSFDGGRTFTPPAPTGLPNTRSGVKPYLLRLRSGRCLLLQTDEHLSDHRLNVTAFLTDEAGLLQGRFLYKRVLCRDCRARWQGSAYPTAAQGADGAIHIAFAAFTQTENRLYHLNVSEDWLMGAVYEPAGGMLSGDDAVPRWETGGMRFTNTRARAQAGRFGALRGARFVHVRAEVAAYPASKAFDLLALSSRGGSTLEIALSLTPAGVTLRDARGETPLLPCGAVDARVTVRGGNRYEIVVNGQAWEAFGRGFGDPDTLMTLGDYDEGETMDVLVTAFEYGNADEA